MRPFKRSKRVGGELQKIISDVLTTKVRDPRLDLVTITGVKMTGDLKIAYIYFSVTNKKITKDDAISGFKSASGFIKHAISKELNLRYMPDLKFYYDDSFDYGSRIDQVIESLNSDHG